MTTNETTGESRQERVANKVGLLALAKAVLKVPAFLCAKDVGFWAKAFVVFSGVYLISPIDLIPEMFFGPIGVIDDVAIVGLALKLINDRMGSARKDDDTPDDTPSESDEDVIDIAAKVVDE